MHIQNTHPKTRIPGPSANLVKCAQLLGFKLTENGFFEDHRDITFQINRIGKDILNAIIKNAWNRVVTKQVSSRKEWSFINDYN